MNSRLPLTARFFPRPEIVTLCSSSLANETVEIKACGDHSSSGF